jgi:polysaccharide export outer membrane protein
MNCSAFRKSPPGSWHPRAWLAALALVLLAAAAAANGEVASGGKPEATTEGGQAAPQGPPPPAQADYVIGPQDVLSITVWDEPTMSRKVAVESDGTFTFPLIGRIKAGGLTLRQFEAELKKRLADGYFKNPQVSVAVEEYRSQRVFLVGEVRNPGTYPLTGNMTLVEALARAGSTMPTAGGEAIIVRAPAGKKSDRPLLPGETPDAQVIRVDLLGMQQGNLAQNISLRDGDTISVPRAQTIYVYGHVKNPGAYALQTKDTTVLQALALAGGITDRGASNRIKIMRVVAGKKKEIKVKLTDPVLPGDTIMVPERFF